MYKASITNDKHTFVTRKNYCRTGEDWDYATVKVLFTVQRTVICNFAATRSAKLQLPDSEMG